MDSQGDFHTCNVVFSTLNISLCFMITLIEFKHTIGVMLNFKLLAFENIVKRRVVLDIKIESQ